MLQTSVIKDKFLETKSQLQEAKDSLLKKDAAHKLYVDDVSAVLDALQTLQKDFEVAKETISSQAFEIDEGNREKDKLKKDMSVLTTGMDKFSQY